MIRPIIYSLAAVLLIASFLVERKIEAPPPAVAFQSAPTEIATETIDPTPVTINRYLTLEEVTGIMNTWNSQAPQITEYGTVGKTSQGREIKYLKIGRSGPKILIHAAIHGNERISTSCTLYMMNLMLKDYGKDENITWLINNRQVYFVPVLSVDSYVANKRHAEGLDPNRNYPCPENPNQVSVSPLRAIQQFHAKHKFAGVISGHSYGRIYLYPRFGPDIATLKSLASEMGQISGYRVGPVAREYPTRNPQARGYDVDWYYWSGSVSLLTEFGVGSHNMNPAMLESEAQKNYQAYMLFIRKAPDIKLIGFKSSDYRRRARTGRQLHRPGA